MTFEVHHQVFDIGATAHLHNSQFILFRSSLKVNVVGHSSRSLGKLLLVKGFLVMHNGEWGLTNSCVMISKDFLPPSVGEL